ncbi:hypothetical protein SAMN05216436_10189 [bacterium A37T11]|nr:hypothetical protein SAMN05216436_10189 [bacterium A37T11]
MRTPKLISNYKHLSDADLASLATRTADALRTNTNFPDLNPAFAEYEVAALDYVAKQGITANRNASAQQKKEKDEARDTLVIMMRRAASYINNFTNVSSIQLSSGFLPVADAKSVGSPGTPAWSRIRPSSRPAEILLDFPAVPEAYDYEMQIAWERDAENQLIWQAAGSNSNSRGNFYTPVQDATKYFFRVRARNKRGISGWSPVSSLIAQVDA